MPISVGKTLVTGARGAIGANLLRHLHDAGVEVHAASSKPQQGQTLLNLHDPATFPDALSGVEQVFLYANAETAGDFASAAAVAGVRHIVLLSSNAVVSVPDPATNPMSAPLLIAEAALVAAAAAVTVLRPGAFAANARQWAYGIRSHHTVDLPYPHARLDVVHERDIAEVAYHCLTRPDLIGATLNLTGPHAISLTEQVRALASALGQHVTINQITRAAWKQSVGGYITDDYADALLNYWKSFEDRPAPITTTIRDITGHEATSFTTWARENVGWYR